MSNNINLNFGEVIAALKCGSSAARSGWNGRGMYVTYVPAKPLLTNPDVTLQPHFVIRNVDGSLSTWVPSVNDTLATDWLMVDVPPQSTWLDRVKGELQQTKERIAAIQKTLHTPPAILSIYDLADLERQLELYGELAVVLTSRINRHSNLNV